MKKVRYHLPSISALIAFECAARWCNFSTAAKELNTSQSAISRHILNLESSLGGALFVRRGKRLSLSSKGERYYHVVVTCLDQLQHASDDLKKPSDTPVRLAYSQDISHLFIRPRLKAIRKAMSKKASLELLSSDKRTGALLGADVWLTHRHLAPSARKAIPLLPETVTPLCSAEFWAKHQDVLSQACFEWRDLPLLTLSDNPTQQLDWSDWFEFQGVPALIEQVELLPCSDMVELIEAAVSGEGIALGWIELLASYLDRGALQAISSQVLNNGGGVFAFMSIESALRPEVNALLSILENISENYTQIAPLK